MTLTAAGERVVVTALDALVSRIVLFSGDRELATLPAPDFIGVARIGGTLTRYEAQDADGVVLFAAPMGQGLTATAGFVDQRAEVRLTDMEIIVA